MEQIHYSKILVLGGNYKCLISYTWLLHPLPASRVIYVTHVSPHPSIWATTSPDMLVTHLQNWPLYDKEFFMLILQFAKSG